MPLGIKRIYCQQYEKPYTWWWPVIILLWLSLGIVFIKFRLRPFPTPGMSSVFEFHITVRQVSGWWKVSTILTFVGLCVICDMWYVASCASLHWKLTQEAATQIIVDSCMPTVDDHIGSKFFLQWILGIVDERMYMKYHVVAIKK